MKGTKLAGRRINEFKTNLTLTQWTMLWNSFIGGKVMAAGSELLVDCSFSGKNGGRKEFNY